MAPLRRKKHRVRFEDLDYVVRPKPPSTQRRRFCTSNSSSKGSTQPRIDSQQRVHLSAPPLETRFRSAGRLLTIRVDPAKLTSIISRPKGSTTVQTAPDERLASSDLSPRIETDIPVEAREEEHGDRNRDGKVLAEIHGTAARDASITAPNATYPLTPASDIVVGNGTITKTESGTGTDSNTTVEGRFDRFPQNLDIREAFLRSVKASLSPKTDPSVRPSRNASDKSAPSLSQPAFQIPTSQMAPMVPSIPHATTTNAKPAPKKRGRPRAEPPQGRPVDNVDRALISSNLGHSAASGSAMSSAPLQSVEDSDGGSSYTRARPLSKVPKKNKNTTAGNAARYQQKPTAVEIQTENGIALDRSRQNFSMTHSPKAQENNSGALLRAVSSLPTPPLTSNTDIREEYQPARGVFTASDATSIKTPVSATTPANSSPENAQAKKQNHGDSAVAIHPPPGNKTGYKKTLSKSASTTGRKVTFRNLLHHPTGLPRKTATITFPCDTQEQSGLPLSEGIEGRSGLPLNEFNALSFNLNNTDASEHSRLFEFGVQYGIGLGIRSYATELGGEISQNGTVFGQSIMPEDVDEDWKRWLVEDIEEENSIFKRTVAQKAGRLYNGIAQMAGISGNCHGNDDDDKDDDISDDSDDDTVIDEGPTKRIIPHSKPQNITPQ